LPSIAQRLIKRDSHSRWQTTWIPSDVSVNGVPWCTQQSHSLSSIIRCLIEATILKYPGILHIFQERRNSSLLPLDQRRQKAGSLNLNFGRIQTISDSLRRVFLGRQLRERMADGWAQLGDVRPSGKHGHMADMAMVNTLQIGKTNNLWWPEGKCAFPNQPKQETQVCSAFRQNSKFPSCWHESRPDMKTRSSKTNWIVLVSHDINWLVNGRFIAIFHHISPKFKYSRSLHHIPIFYHISPCYPHITIHKTGCYITLRRILIPCTAAELHAEQKFSATSGAPNSAHGTTGFRIKAPELRHVPGN
jgi:hypothetical protein